MSLTGVAVAFLALPPCRAAPSSAVKWVKRCRPNRARHKTDTRSRRDFDTVRLPGKKPDGPTFDHGNRFGFGKPRIICDLRIKAQAVRRAWPARPVRDRRGIFRTT